MVFIFYKEIEPYVPAGILMGGKLDGIPVVTKAGGFGSENILISAMKFFGLLGKA